jgi:hypothetical protein
VIHRIPAEWLEEVGLQNLIVTGQGFRCEVPHVLIAIIDIEPPTRNEGVTLDANGFSHDRMTRILRGILDGDALPPINVEAADPGQRPYRLRGGFHRLYASRTCRFSHIPADIVQRLD